jgi:hypothetical protein
VGRRRREEEVKKGDRTPINLLLKRKDAERSSGEEKTGDRRLGVRLLEGDN